MSDLVERLGLHALFWEYSGNDFTDADQDRLVHDLREAADRIEELEQAIKEMVEGLMTDQTVEILREFREESPLDH